MKSEPKPSESTGPDERATFAESTRKEERMTMSAHEFEVLKTWVEAKISIALQIEGRELDKPYVEAQMRDDAAADDAARAGLVVDFAPVPAMLTESTR
jgi:hypothetical protein